MILIFYVKYCRLLIVWSVYNRRRKSTKIEQQEEEEECFEKEDDLGE